MQNPCAPGASLANALFNSEPLVSLWPFVVLAGSILAIVIAIGRYRIHPFPALIFAGLVAGMLSRLVPNSTLNAEGAATIPSLGHALALLLDGFGNTAKGVALSIGLASIIGYCMMAAGAADRVVRAFLRVFGQTRAGLALLASAYVLSLPIFFDTMFLLMAPLAKALAVRTGRDYLLYLLCICIGAAVTHSLTVPHPGPIAAVELLKIDVGLSIVAGIVVGIVPALAGYAVASALNRRRPLPMRPLTSGECELLERPDERPLSSLPGLASSLVPVLLPVVLISCGSAMKIADDALPQLAALAPHGSISREIIDFIGDRNIALFIGACCALRLIIRAKRWRLREAGPALAGPLETAGTIILITSAGGAFGFMIRHAGVGPAVQALFAGKELNFILLGYLLAFIVRVAQGSATVAMITASAIVAPMLEGQGGSQPLFVFLAIGFASFAASWMNDSGFWVVSKIGGLTEKETLSTFSVALTVVSLCGLLVTLLAAYLWPG